MEDQQFQEAAEVATFGRGKVIPRACIADAKQHVRVWLGEALEELGFAVCECAKAHELNPVLDVTLPDLVVIGFSGGGVEAAGMVRMLATKFYRGKVLLIGPYNSPMVKAVQELGEGLGLAMLPLLATPYRNEHLRQTVADLLPAELPPCLPVDASEALQAGWLELWYQPKIDARTVTLRGAEALIRMRHPNWGIVPPAYFMPDDGDPHFCALSEFVIDRAVADWHYFVSEHRRVNIAINLPIAFLQAPESIRTLCQKLPDHPAFQGLIVEINETEAVRNLDLTKKIARQLRFHNIGISIDNLGAERPSLFALDDFPFVELKVDRKFVSGCADDRLKQSVCRRIIDLANDHGARTVAECVETRADFFAVRDMGFDFVQGFLFAKPMPARKFARSMLCRPVTMPQ